MEKERTLSRRIIPGEKRKYGEIYCCKQEVRTQGKRRLFCAACTAGMLFAAGGRLAALGTELPWTVKLLSLLLCGALAAFSDIRRMKIPNALILSAAVLRLLLLLPDIVFYGTEAGLKLFAENLCGAAVFYAVLAGISLLMRGGIGQGDVKLLAAAALMAGPGFALETLFFGLVSVLPAALGLVIAGKCRLKDRLPFAPFLWAGMLIAAGLGGI